MELKAPTCLEIEPTEGCNLHCNFCGIHRLLGQGKIWNHLSVSLAGRLAEQTAGFCPRARIEFGGHGEPLVNPSCLEIFSIFRKYATKTQLQVTTNGVVFLKNWPFWRDCLKDINVLVIDLYEPYGTRLRNTVESNPGDWKITDFFRDGFNPWHNHGPIGNTVVLMDDLRTKSGQRIQRKLDNRAGNSDIIPPVTSPLNKNCSFPFRRLSVRWDGKVHICCMDWGLEYCVGDVGVQSFNEVWYGNPYQSARRFLSAKNRSFAPCCFCDYTGGVMKGLLPKMEGVTEDDTKTVKTTNENSPRYNGRAAHFVDDVNTKKRIFF